MGVCLGTNRSILDPSLLDPNEIEIPKPLCVLREELLETVFYGLKNVFLEANLKNHKKNRSPSSSPNSKDKTAAVKQEGLENVQESQLFALYDFSQRLSNVPRMSYLDPTSLARDPLARRGTEEMIYQEQLEKDPLNEKQRALMHLLQEHFKSFCFYRFYNSHSKAIEMRREELQKNTFMRGEHPRRQYTMKPQEDDDMEIENEHEYDQVFLSRDTIKITSGKKKPSQNNRESVTMLKETLKKFGLMGRADKFNENVDEDYTIKKLLEEDNVVVASWINDMGLNHQEFDDKIVFFTNETLLFSKETPVQIAQEEAPKSTLMEHFDAPIYKKLLQDKNIEFICKKGGGQSSMNTSFYLPYKQNQDNFFIVTDSEMKIFGVFDGHGEFGHLVSSFAAGIMLDYIRNKDKFLRPLQLFQRGNQYELDIKKAFRRCFKYTQERLKVIQKAFDSQMKTKQTGGSAVNESSQLKSSLKKDFVLGDKIVEQDNEDSESSDEAEKENNNYSQVLTNGVHRLSFSPPQNRLFQEKQVHFSDDHTDDSRQFGHSLEIQQEDLCWSESSWEPDDLEQEIDNQEELHDQEKKLQQQRLKSRFIKQEEKKEKVGGKHKHKHSHKEDDIQNIVGKQIEDEKVYGSEADESYDDEDEKSRSNSNDHNTSSDSLEDDEDSIDDGDISRQEEEVDRIKYQIGLKKKEREIERLNKVKEKLQNHFMKTLSTATNTGTGQSRSPSRGPNNESPDKTVGKPGMASGTNSKDQTKVPIKTRVDLFKQLRERELIDRIASQNKKDFKRFDMSMSGCSGTVMIQTPNKIYLAWVGDTHAVLCQQERKTQAVKLTQDPEHTAFNKRELNRIYKNRGEIKTGFTLSGDKKPRVYVRGRTFPGLSVTRSLGDLLAHQIGVTSEPSVRIINLSPTQSELFVAIGTDGIWDYMTPDDLVDEIKDHGMKEVGVGSEHVASKIRDLSSLGKQALDDMTLVISHLKREG